MPHSSTPTVAAAVADLIFGGRIRGDAQAAGVKATFARNADELLAAAASARLVLLDLDARWLRIADVMAALKADPATAAVPVVAFVSHVRTDAIDAARAAGVDRVMARSAFARDLPALLARVAGG